MPNLVVMREVIFDFLQNPYFRNAFLEAVENDPRPEGIIRRQWFPEYLSNDEGIAKVAKGSAGYLVSWLQHNPRDLRGPDDVLRLWWDLQHGKTTPFPLCQG